MEEQAAAGTLLGSNPKGFYILHLENCISKIEKTSKYQIREINFNFIRVKTMLKMKAASR